MFDISGALGALFSWQFLLFSIAISTITWILRTITEFVVPTIVNYRVYQKLFLPLSATFTGAIVAMVAIKYAFPAGLNSFSDRVLFGLVAGNFSSSLFQVAKGMLKEKIQAIIQDTQNNRLK